MPVSGGRRLLRDVNASALSPRVEPDPTMPPPTLATRRVRAGSGRDRKHEARGMPACGPVEARPTAPEGKRQATPADTRR